MRKLWGFLAVVGVGLWGVASPVDRNESLLQSSHEVYAAEGPFQSFLPMIAFPEGTEIQSLKNGSFEEPWHDLPPAGDLTNQRPNGWELSWVEKNQPLYDSSDIAGGVPECVHKLKDQLPPHEWPGEPEALILDGEVTYKIFHFEAPFGAELKQVVSGLQPGQLVQLQVPILLDRHGNTDPYGAESGVWINGGGDWANAEDMGQRNWYTHIVNTVVPGNGELEVVIRVKSKYGEMDFFIDDIRLYEISSR